MWDKVLPTIFVKSLDFHCFIHNSQTHSVDWAHHMKNCHQNQPWFTKECFKSFFPFFRDLSGYFTRGDAKTFQDILLCSTMVAHHFPIVVLNSLNKLNDQKHTVIEVVR